MIRLSLTNRPQSAAGFFSTEGIVESRETSFLTTTIKSLTELLKTSHVLSYKHILGFDSRGLVCGWLLIIFSFSLKRNKAQERPIVRLFFFLLFSGILISTTPKGWGHLAKVTHRSLRTYGWWCYSPRVENWRQLVQKIHLYLLLPQLWADWWSQLFLIFHCKYKTKTRMSRMPLEVRAGKSWPGKQPGSQAWQTSAHHLRVSSQSVAVWLISSLLWT